MNKSKSRLVTKVEITNKKFFVIVMVAVLFGVMIVTSTWVNPISGKWHESDEIKLQIGGENYSLQEAVDQGLIVGGTGKIVFIPPVQIAYDNILNSEVNKIVDVSSYVSPNAKGIIIENTITYNGQATYFMRTGSSTSVGFLYIGQGSSTYTRDQAFVPFHDQKSIKYSFTETTNIFRSSNTITLLGYYE